MADEALTQEDVFSNDIDPLEAIRALRKESGATDDDLKEIVSEEPAVETPKEETNAEADAEEIENLKAEEPKNEEENESDKKGTEPKAKEPLSDEVSDEDNNKVTTEDETNLELKPDEETDDGTTSTHSTAEKENKTEKKNPEVKSDITKFRANGQDFEFTKEEMLGQFETVFGQAMDYTQKMQKIAPYRKMISALEEEGISSDQLNIAIDALKGDKGALQKILEINKIDNDDLTPDDDDEPYKPTDYGKNEFQLGIEEITSRIEKDPEYKITVDVIDQQWDQHSRETIAKNPSMIEGLHNDIKTGLYDKVAPVAMKMKVLDGNTKSDIEYYMIAGEKLRLEEQDSSKKTVDELNKPAQNADSKFEEASSEAKTKRAATSTRARSDRKGVIDYLDDDDADFDAWYKKLQASN